jgi:hypothetical protein
VISNSTGRPVFFCVTVARSRTLPATNTSSTLSRTRSHPLSLLSIAKLNMADRAGASPSGGGHEWSRHPSASAGAFGRSGVPYSTVCVAGRQSCFRWSCSSPKPTLSAPAPDRRRSASSPYLKWAQPRGYPPFSGAPRNGGVGPIVLTNSVIAQ